MVREACGLSMAELVAKAAAPGAESTLYFDETRFIMSAHVVGGSMQMIEKRARMSPEDRELWSNAMLATRSEQMMAANKNAVAAQLRWKAAKAKAQSSIPKQEFNLMMVAMDVPWQQHVLHTPGPSSIGLVVLFSERPSWPSYKTEIERCVQDGLTMMCFKVQPEIYNRFAWQYIPASGNGAELQSTFHAVVPDLPSGIRSDCFLYVDDEALLSKDSAKPFVWLHEPNTSLEPLKIDIRHICPGLFARLTQRDFTVEERRSQPFKTEPDLAGLHTAASNSLAEDSIWPPIYFRA